MTDPLLPCSAHSTIILAKVMRVLHSAASAHGDSEHSTAELDALPFMPAQAFAAHGGRMALDVRFPRRADVSLRLLADEADRGRIAPLANETR